MANLSSFFFRGIEADHGYVYRKIAFFAPITPLWLVLQYIVLITFIVCHLLC